MCEAPVMEVGPGLKSGVRIRMELCRFALGFQGHAAIPVVGHPPGQAQFLGSAGGKIPEPHALHPAGEPPAPPYRAHPSIPVTV